MTALRVAVIGCGSIGSRLDEAAPDGPAQTHASAIRRNPDTVLDSLCDVDAATLAHAGQVRGVSALYADWRALLRERRPDGVSLCLQPLGRLDIIAAAIEAGVRFIWCEKPLAASLEEARAIADLVSRHPRLIFAVNYLRRWSPGVTTMSRLIASGELGAPVSAIGLYSKGIANNGSHLLDLVDAVLGPIDHATALGCVADDRQDSDPTLHALLKAGNVPVHLVAVDHRDYSLFEFDILLSRGRLRLTGKGDRLEIHRVEPDHMFAGYTTLALQQTLTGQLGDAMEEGLRDIVACVRGQRPGPKCGVHHALRSQQCAEALLKSWNALAPAAQSLARDSL